MLKQFIFSASILIAFSAWGYSDHHDDDGNQAAPIVEQAQPQQSCDTTKETYCPRRTWFKKHTKPIDHPFLAQIVSGLERCGFDDLPTWLWTTCLGNDDSFGIANETHYMLGRNGQTVLKGYQQKDGWEANFEVHYQKKPGHSYFEITQLVVKVSQSSWPWVQEQTVTLIPTQNPNAVSRQILAKSRDFQQKLNAFMQLTQSYMKDTLNDEDKAATRLSIEELSVAMLNKPPRTQYHFLLRLRQLSGAGCSSCSLPLVEKLLNSAGGKISFDGLHGNAAVEKTQHRQLAALILAERGRHDSNVIDLLYHAVDDDQFGSVANVRVRNRAADLLVEFINEGKIEFATHVARLKNKFGHKPLVLLPILIRLHNHDDTLLVGFEKYLFDLIYKSSSRSPQCHVDAIPLIRALFKTKPPLIDY
jgi:hypothetical protein